MGNGFGAALKSIAGGMATGAGVAMREERLAKYAQDKVDAQNRFTSGENDKNRTSRATLATNENASKMALLTRQGVQNMEVKQAGIASQLALVKQQGIEARNNQDGKAADALDQIAARLTGELSQLDKKLASSEKIATKKIVSTEKIAKSERTSKENLLGMTIASAEKIAGGKVASIEKIAGLNIKATEKNQQKQIAATAQNLQRQIFSNLVIVRQKIESAEKVAGNKDVAAMERLEKSLTSAQENLNKKISSTEWLKFLDRELTVDEGKKKRETTTSEGDKNRSLEDTISKRKTIINATRPNTFGKPDPEAIKSLQSRGLLPKPPAAPEPYTGEDQPAGHPTAKKSLQDGFWYVTDANGNHSKVTQ